MSPKRKKWQEVCKFLGEDLDSEPCKIVREHMEECPDCNIYVDRIKRTVRLFKESDQCEKLPERVSKNLFVKLDLKEYFKEDEEKDQPEE